MRRMRWQILLGLFLVCLSAVLYLLHYVIFGDPHHIFIYMIGDIAFVPIEVLMVTLIIHQLLSERERRARLEKLNMVIGAFFSEVGRELLVHFSNADPELDNIRKDLMVTDDWSEQEFSRVGRRLNSYSYGVEISKISLGGLCDFLTERRGFLLRLLENPNLPEHESFTEVLRAVFHLTEELESREDLSLLPDTDHEHLAGDIRRAYIVLGSQWLDYMKYMKDNYPYLFSLAMRTNPFDQDVSPIVMR